MKFFTIRNADFAIIGRGPCDAQGLRDALTVMPDLKRIDIWGSKSALWLKPGASRNCMIGLCWANGSTTIFDFPDIVEASKIFSEAIEAGLPAPIFRLKETA